MADNKILNNDVLEVKGVIAHGELRIGTHAVHDGYTGLWNTEASTTTTGQYLIISAGTDTYINGDSVYIRGGNNSTTNQLKVSTSGTYIGGNEVWHAGNSVAFTSDDNTKLDNIEAGADVTDATNVSAAGAMLKSGEETSTAMKSFETTLTNNDDWQNSPISILERGDVGNTQSADKYAPNLNFHWGGRVSNSLWMTYNGILNWGSYNSSGIPASDGTFKTGTLYAGAQSITATKVSNWNTAYGWGDHADGGYLTSETYTGTVTSVTVGTGLDVANGTTTPNITLDLSELTDMTAAINTSQDELILLDNGAERRKLFSEIFGSAAYSNTSAFAAASHNHDSSYPAKSDSYISLFSDSWSDTPEAKYIQINLPYNSGSGGSSYYVFDVFGFHDIRQMDSAVNYRVYAHIRSNGTEQNSVKIHVYTLHENQSDFFEFAYKINAGAATNFFIYVEHDYSGIEIFGLPLEQGQFAELTSSMISSTETAPTGTTQVVAKVAHPSIGTTAGTYGNTANGTKIDTITIDEHGHVTGVATGATGNMTGFFVEDGDGTEVQINNANEWKFVEGTGIDINWTDTSTGNDSDPYDLTFGIKDNSIGITQLDVTDGTNGQVLTTNGSGTLSFATVTSGTSYGWNLGGTDIESGDEVALDGGLSLSGTGGSYTLSSATYTAGTGLTLSGTEFSVTANTYAAASHNHDSLYHKLDFDAITGAHSTDEKSGTWTGGSGTSWGSYKPGNDSNAGSYYNDGTGYAQYNIPSGYTTAYIGQLKWSSGGYFDVYAVDSNGNLVLRGRYMSLQSIENSNHNGNHDYQQIIKISGLDGFSAIRIQNRSGRIHLQGIGWTKEEDTDSTADALSHWDLIYGKPSTFSPSSHSHSDATTSASGFMSSTDKSKLDGISTGADVTPSWVPATDPSYLTAHPNITAASSSDNSGRTYIQDITLDSNGHVTGITTATETVTNTNTTYSAGSGLDLTGTTFSIESDLRDGITRIGKDTSNYIAIDADDNNSIDFYISGVWVARMEADGDLHMKGDVIAYSSIFNP